MSRNKNHYFVGYKALGFISNEIPVEVGYFKKRNEPYIITCVGKAFHTYTCPKLGITNISDSLTSDISVLKADEKFVYAAASTEIYVFIQFKKVIHVLKGHKAPISHLLPFGDHLVSIDEDKNLKVWQSDIAEVYSETLLQFEVSCLLHPHHYNNKILLAYNNGTMQLFNINQSKVLYDFKGWSAPITSLQQSQALDIVGVGLKDGHIHLHHLRNDQTFISFRQNWGAVTAITFRTDLQHVMLTGSESGHVAVWHLKDKRLLSQSMNLHEGPVTSLVSINNQSIVVSSSNDNSLKVWVSDNEDSVLRLLNTRSGHSKPPCHIKFHDQHTILSAGLDNTLRSFSCIHDSYNKSLGRCRLRKMKRKKTKNDDVNDDTPENDVNLLSHVTCFASQTARQSDWDGIVCCHENQDVATTWNFNKKTLGKHHFRAIVENNITDHNKNNKHKNRSINYDRKATCKCADISTCGNFAVVGFSNGLIFKFNMQSGLHRGCYGDDASKHDGVVSGVFVDGLNKRMVSIGWDGCLKAWDFASRKMEDSLKFKDSLKLGVFCRDNNLLAVARDDFVVEVVDINSLKVVRCFKEHRNDITDMSYGRSGRWLLTACMDGCIRLFDLLSASLIDVIQTPSPPTSVSLSSSNELLATTHVDQLGIYLWFNTCLYSKASEDFVVGDVEVEMPKTKVESSDEGEEEEEKGENVFSVEGVQEGQVASLVTLAQRGHLKVNSLLHYDLIKERNKPKEGLKKDEKAPFFLPSSLLKEPLFEVKQEEEQTKEVEHQIPLLPTKLASMLQECQQHHLPTKQFEDIQKYILSISIGLLDTELKFLLSDITTESNQNLSLFVSFLAFWIKSNNHADLANAIVLRMTELKPSALLSTTLEELLNSLEKQFGEIRRQHHTSQALLSFVSGNSHFFPLS